MKKKKAGRYPCLSGTLIILLLSYSKMQILLKNLFSCAPLDRHPQRSVGVFDAFDPIKNHRSLKVLCNGNYDLIESSVKWDRTGLIFRCPQHTQLSSSWKKPWLLFDFSSPFQLVEGIHVITYYYLIHDTFPPSTLPGVLQGQCSLQSRFQT